ncbi:MAG: carboxypeptidase regulatory-like domain-containing protein [Haliscomenobacter sp.]|nr:carboxypeptidase regulatory-like domain-containing protein [Haliscomenobacter sp.]
MKIEVFKLLTIICVALLHVQVLAQGDLVWALHTPASRFLPGGNESGQAIARDGAGNIVVAGAFSGRADFDPGQTGLSLVSAGGADAFIAKYAPDGALIWVKALGGLGADQVTALAVDTSGAIYAAGSFSFSADFDPGPSTATLVSSGQEDAFLLKWGRDGNFIWARKMGGPLVDRAAAVAIDSAGMLHCGGVFAGRADMDPGPAQQWLTSVGNSPDIFWVRFTQDGILESARQLGGPGADQLTALKPSGTSVYFAGAFTDSLDLDLGPGLAQFSSRGQTDGFIARYNAAGVFAWARQIGGVGEEIVSDVAVSSPFGIAITGSFTGDVLLDSFAEGGALSGKGGTDLFIAVYNAEGAFLRSATLGGVGEDRGLGIERDPATGGLFACGYFAGEAVFRAGAFLDTLKSHGDRDMALIALDKELQGLWAHPVGGASQDGAVRVMLDVQGRPVFTGSFKFLADFDPGPGTQNLGNTAGFGDDDGFILKLDAAGALVWASHFGAARAQESDQIRDTGIDSNENLYLLGSFQGRIDADPSPALYPLDAQGSEALFLSKLDSSGAFQWARSIDGASGTLSAALATDTNGNSILAGGFSGSIRIQNGVGVTPVSGEGGNPGVFFASFSSQGLLNWVKSISGNGLVSVTDVELDSAGNYTVAGTINGVLDFDPGPLENTLSSPGGNNVFLARYDRLGNLLWARKFGGSASISGVQLALDEKGNSFVSGSFSGGLEAGEGGSLTFLNSNSGSFDGFYCRFDSQGNFAWIRGIGGPGVDQVFDLAVTPSNTLCITGAAFPGADVDPGPEQAILPNAGFFDAFLAGYDLEGNYLFSQNFGGPGIEYGQNLTAAPDGTLYLGGVFTSGADVDPGPEKYTLNSTFGTLDLFLLQLDHMGNLKAVAQAGGLGSEWSNALALAPNRTVYLAGYFDQATNFGGKSFQSINARDGFLAKYRFRAFPAAIAGTVKNPFGRPLPGVRIRLTGATALETVTDSAGAYQFSRLPLGQTYSLQPVPDSSAFSQGITTLDQLVLARHLLGIQVFAQPAQWLAADINGSKSLTSMDLWLLQKQILGQRPRIPGVPVWRYWDAGFSLPSAPQLWNARLPDFRRIENLQADQRADFIGVKTGDVDFSANK